MPPPKIDPEAGWPGPDTLDKWGNPLSRRDYWRGTVQGFLVAATFLIGFGVLLRWKNPEGAGQFSAWLVLGGVACLLGAGGTVLWLRRERRSGRWG